MVYHTVAPLRADTLDPVPAANHTPFTAVLGFPLLRSADLKSNGTSSWRAHYSLASHSAIGRDAFEQIQLDGETSTINIEYRRNLSDNWQLALSVPWISHQRGFLDHAIDTWHRVSGLANGQRDRQARDQLLFQYQGAGNAVSLNDSVSRPGDARVELLHQFATSAKRNITLRGTVELPTGKARYLTGNGAVDLSVDLLGGGQRTLYGRPLRWHLQAGVLRHGEGDLLQSARRPLVPFAAAGLSLQWHPRVSVYVQTNVLARAWRSELDQLGDTAVELTTGIGWSASGSGDWYVAVSEDLTIDRSPDVVFRIGWRDGRSTP